MPCSGLESPRPWCLGQPLPDPVSPSAGPAGSSRGQDRGRRDAGTRAWAVRRAQEEEGRGPETDRGAGAAVSLVCFSHRTQMRGVREDSSEISRQGSGECLDSPPPHLAVTSVVWDP